MASSLPPGDRYVRPGSYTAYVAVPVETVLYSSPNDFLVERRDDRSLYLSALPFTITVQQICYVRITSSFGNVFMYTPTDYAFEYNSVTGVLTIPGIKFAASDLGYQVCISARPRATDESMLSRESSSLRVLSESSLRENPRLYCIAPDQLVVDPVVAETPETQFSTVPEIPLDFDDED
jgi:hypothetical protein